MRMFLQNERLPFTTQNLSNSFALMNFAIKNEKTINYIIKYWF